MSESLSARKLIVFTAPSGSGKTTVVRHLVRAFESLAFSVSATTRARRAHERHGRDYYFLSTDTFRLWEADDVFVEWEEVYPNQWYGTPAFEIDRLWALGKHVIFDIDVKGALSIKKCFPDETTIVFVKVPSQDQLVKRLRSRGTESEESLNKRVQRAREELKYEERCDIVLVNDELDDTLRRAERIVAEIIGLPLNSTL